MLPVVVVIGLLACLVVFVLKVKGQYHHRWGRKR